MAASRTGPFILGVAGGTASGKVRGGARAPLHLSLPARG